MLLPRRLGLEWCQQGTDGEGLNFFTGVNGQIQMSQFHRSIDANFSIFYENSSPFPLDVFPAHVMRL